MNNVSVRILQALSDPTRLCLLSIISKKEICACELPSRVHVSQPAVSQHLAVLLKAGLVLCRVDGRKRLYSATPRAKLILKSINQWH